MLQIKHLTASVGKKTILKDISYTFEKDKVYVLMGPNGSGKSTFAHTIIGQPAYAVDGKSSIEFDGQELTGLPPDKRAQAGIFLSFQSPLSLKGITVFQLLRIALNGRKDPLTLKQEIMKLSKTLKIRTDVVERSLNEGASGGEKKKIEILQAAILNPKLAIFDEVDTGVDIDALKTLSKYISTFKKGRTLIFITHNSRILKYIAPDIVLVLKEGAIVKTGTKELLDAIERDGFEKL